MPRNGQGRMVKQSPGTHRDMNFKSQSNNQSRPCRVMQGESEKDMEIIVNEFLGMAFDNTFEFVVYDFTTNKNIFDSTVDE